MPGLSVGAILSGMGGVSWKTCSLVPFPMSFAAARGMLPRTVMEAGAWSSTVHRGRTEKSSQRGSPTPSHQRHTSSRGRPGNAGEGTGLGDAGERAPGVRRLEVGHHRGAL
eukprot:EG_transcript_30094